MGGSSKKEASYADVLNAPPNKVAEIIHGELVLSPRPAGPHTVAATAEILRLSASTPGEWSANGVHRDDAKVRAKPFEQLELDLSILWRDVQL